MKQLTLIAVLFFSLQSFGGNPPFENTSNKLATFLCGSGDHLAAFRGALGIGMNTSKIKNISFEFKKIVFEDGYAVFIPRDCWDKIDSNHFTVED